MARSSGTPVAAASAAASHRYGMSRHLSRVKRRSTSTASSSNAHGTRTEWFPCSRLWLESSPKAHHRL
jgi:hypothetical protein